MPLQRKLSDCRLYAILDTGYFQGRDPAEIALQMIAGGIDLIQVRAKNHSRRKTAKLLKVIQPIARAHSIPMIVNDDPILAAEIGAEGVHVGQNDMSVSETRKIVGPSAWIGKSTHSFKQALQAQCEDVDYIGVGPIFATPTKPDYPPVGLELIEKVSSHLKIPFFCIGGIKLENARQVLQAGGKGIVVVSGILLAPDIVKYCRALKLC